MPDSPACASHPAKLFVETTTRCNLKCPMCVKQTPGTKISEGDLDPALFQSLLPALPYLDKLILNGIGEPLLHSELAGFISRAREMMPAHGRIGFQTNGMLLDESRALELAAAGANLICLSLDSSVPQTFAQVRTGGTLAGINRALAGLRQTRRQYPDLRLGVEIVLNRETLAHLAETVRWAVAQGVDFAIVTHLIAYTTEMTSQAVFDPNTDAALALLADWRVRGRKAGLDINNYYRVRWKYRKTAHEQRLIEFVDAMLAEAAAQNIFFHLKNLLNCDGELRQALADAFCSAKTVAAETGFELRLPAMTPQARKQCDFIESGSAFVSVNGDVHPCYFLWHGYQCHVSGWQKYVTPRVFGNLADDDILTIWNKSEFCDFRVTVSGYDYPLCSNCNLAPCDYIDTPEFEQDCYTNTIPCCDCQWCLGIFQCLQ